MLLERNPFDVNYQYLFELKFCKKKDHDWDKKEQEGIKQIQGYLQLDDIQNIASPKNNLKSYLIISDGDDLNMIRVEKKI